MANYPMLVSQLLVVLSMTALFAGCSRESATTSGGGQTIHTANGGTEIRLNASANFRCDSRWTIRDGAKALSKGSGNGNCEATFPGPSGTYRVEVAAQTEYDGQSSYAIGVNHRIVNAGMYPLSTPTLDCSCTNCSDKRVSLSAGTHQINTGDNISFIGQEAYYCGTTHGASAKWHDLVFIPVN